MRYLDTRPAAGGGPAARVDRIDNVFGDELAALPEVVLHDEVVQARHECGLPVTIAAANWSSDL